MGLRYGPMATASRVLLSYAQPHGRCGATSETLGKEEGEGEECEWEPQVDGSSAI